MAITRVHHHTFTVSDMDRSLRFYRDLLGFDLTYDKIRENLDTYDKVMAMKDVKIRVALLTESCRADHDCAASISQSPTHQATDE